MSDVPSENKTTQKPSLFINEITFNDGKPLPLSNNSIVVFTGANNSGKSQVLKDIDRWFDKNHNMECYHFSYPIRTQGNGNNNPNT